MLSMNVPPDATAAKGPRAGLTRTKVIRTGLACCKARPGRRSPSAGPSATVIEQPATASWKLLKRGAVMKACDVMSSPVITVRPEMPVAAAAELLVSHGYTAAVEMCLSSIPS